MSGIPGVVIECKNTKKRLTLAEWQDRDSLGNKRNAGVEQRVRRFL